MSILDLVRPDLRDFAGYASARRAIAAGRVWLNANESPWNDSLPPLNRYPEPQPALLRQQLAQLYGALPEQVLLSRGSDEAIDLLVRALCRSGIDAVIDTPPVFGMYAVSARLQNAPLRSVSLQDGDGAFRLDVDALLAGARESGARLVFLCSPANPTGQALARADVLLIAGALAGQALVVVDEAYGEYSDEPSLVADVSAQPNLAVLRTLSKAHGLAAARIGCLIAAPELTAVLRNCQAPYPLPSPCVELALAALAPERLAIMRRRVDDIRRERRRMQAALAGLPGVASVYASQGNFLLVRFEDCEAAWQSLLATGVVVRDMRRLPQLQDALRISLGAPEENDAVLAALTTQRVAA